MLIVLVADEARSSRSTSTTSASCVEPGVTNVDVSRRGRRRTSSTRPTRQSQIVCSIGGNVAENSGGAHCFKYGFTTNYVIGLEIVLADGELVQLGGKELDPPGYDLLGAFVGSEGTLGVATKIWLRVVPAPETVQDAGRLLRLDARGRRGGLGDRRRRASCPGAIEMMDALAIEATEQMAARRLPGRPRRGAAGRARRRRARVRGALRRGRGDLRALRLRRRPRRARRGRAPAVLEDAQGRVPGDGPDLAQLLRPGRRDPAHQAARGARARSTSSREEYGMIVANVFHAGDGNLHPLVCYDGARRGRGRAGRGAVRADPRRLPGAPAARSPASTASASTRRSTCRRCSPRPTSTRSSACAARSTPPGSRTPAR